MKKTLQYFSIFLILLSLPLKSCKVAEASTMNLTSDTIHYATIKPNIMEEDLLLKELRKEIIESFFNGDSAKVDKDCYIP